MSYATHAQRFDVLCVGDVAADVFITLSPSHVSERLDGDTRSLELPLGSKVPYEGDATVAAGGSGANVAVGMARQGLRVGLASFLAHDEIGRDLFAGLHAEGVDTRLMRIDSPARTNRNFVLLLHGQRTILVRRGSFNYHWPYLRPSDVPAFLYVASLGPDAAAYEEEIDRWLEETPDVRLVLHPGTFQVEGAAQRLPRLLRRTELLVVTNPDAMAIVAALLPASSVASSDGRLLAELRQLGPRRVLLVDDLGGGTALDDDGCYRVPPFPDRSAPLDRTGCVDAFASAATSALVLGQPLREALRRGAASYTSVAHGLGSQEGLLGEKELAAMLEEEPDFQAGPC